MNLFSATTDRTNGCEGGVAPLSRPFRKKDLTVYLLLYELLFMKKYLYFLLLLIPAFALVSCHDDKDLPDVDFDFTFENAVDVDGVLYVVQGETMEITSIQVINNESGKEAMITAANYYWDYYYLGSTVQPPYGFAIDVDADTPVGEHILQVEAPLYAVDKSPATAVVVFRVQVVASPEDIPDQGAVTTRISPSISSTAD